MEGNATTPTPFGERLLTKNTAEGRGLMLYYSCLISVLTKFHEKKIHGRGTAAIKNWKYEIN